jgi:glycosyltransferase involved in cell wall biosynthesis
MIHHWFLVENHQGLSHTFIRADIEAIGCHAPTTIIDITDEFDLLRARPRAFLWAVFRAGVFGLLHPMVGLRILVSPRWLANAKALVTYVALRRRLGGTDGATWITAHFLAKAALIGALAARETGAKLRLVCHASDLYTLPRQMNFVLRSAHVIETVTWFGKGFVFGRIGNDALGRVVMRRNRIQETSGIGQSRGRADSTLALLAVGRLVSQKDLEFGLRVFRHLAGNVPGRATYTIVGDGPLLKSLRDLVTKLGLADKVIFAGAVSNERARELYLESDALLLPCAELTLADADGLPVVFQEALLAGCPVYCRAAFGVAELIVDGFNGRAFEPGESAENWAASILEELPGLDRGAISGLADKQCKRSGRVELTERAR